MAYQKQTWVTGETITEQKLNHMEDGIANAVLIVHENYDETTEITTLDKTWQQIADAGFAVLSRENDGNEILVLSGYGHSGEIYGVGFYNLVEQGNVSYTTNSADGYPTSNR